MVEDVIKVQENFYILAGSSLADDRTRVLKHGETFGVFDRFGDIHGVSSGEQGIFHEGTRYLSRETLRLGGQRPLLLNSAVREDNAVLAVDLTNYDVSANGEVTAARGSLHILRTRFLWKGTSYETLRFRNYGMSPIEVIFALDFDADFADIFEVRGMKRRRRGRRAEDKLEHGAIVICYEGLDGVVRKTRITPSLPPRDLTPAGMRFAALLNSQQAAEYVITASCEADGGTSVRIPYECAVAEAATEREALRRGECHIYTSNEQFNDWLNRSVADLHMMITSTPEMLYPYAGVPWFSTVFGRDGIITALQYLWVNPRLARGVLEWLAMTQADDIHPAQDAEPGKILHEQRSGEMAVLGEHPFHRYYGSVDSTPLFVLLASAYYERSGDIGLIRSIWRNIERALEWIDSYGDRDGDGFVEYARVSENGLVQQGWKDSWDSVFHADGRMAEPPIALCEVQAYVFAAKRGAAALAAALGDDSRASRLESEARALQDEFERAFWDEELSTYALALDGKKRPCRVRASNAGHCLFAGIAGEERAERTAATLLSPEMDSGWGIRTLASSAARYNPMSYHNGSVWPHDNSMIAAGLARYGFQAQTARVLTGLFDAALFMEQHRLPELFCGFPRRPGEGPTRYPVACSPQAWASGAAFLLLQACMGLSLDAPNRQARFRHAFLPEALPEVEIRGLAVAGATVDLTLERHPFSVDVTVQRREGKLEVVTLK